MKKKLLEIKNLSIFKNDDTLISKSDFFVKEGEIVGLFGESGSGKSVFSLFLLGLLNLRVFRFVVDVAVFQFCSKFFHFSSKKKTNWGLIRRNHVSMIFQDPTTTLNPTMTCGKQIKEACFGVCEKDKFEYCLNLLSEVNIIDPEKAYLSFPHQLSGGQRQRVVIAIALASTPSLLIADEPTTSLDPSTQRSVLDLVLSLKKKRSFGVVLISHDLDLISYYCDRVYLFKDSKLLDFSTPSAKSRFSFLKKTLLKIKTRDYSDFSFDDVGFYNKPLFLGKNFVFDLKNISVSFFKKNKRFFALRNISLTVYGGECLGVVGSSGSGKTTLGRVFCGLEGGYDGVFKFSDLSKDFLKKSVQMVYQDPSSSFNPKHTIGDSVSEIINLYGSNYSVSDLFRLVSLDASLSKRYPHQLSGGQKQRASIARVLASNPSVIVFDESLSGLDLEVRISILELIRFINSVLSITIVFISHDINSVYYLCGRIVVLKSGEIIESFLGCDLFLKSRKSYVKTLILDSNFK